MAATSEKYRFLDLSGYAFTGKTAFIELIREFRGYYVPHFTYEFALLRIQGGLLDLQTALLDDWSPVRSDAAIRRFMKLVDRIGGRNSYFNPASWFTAVGWEYERIYNGRFCQLSDQYVQALTEATWQAEWPYAMLEWSGWTLFRRKLWKKLGVPEPYKSKVYLTNPDKFLSATKDYLAGLLTANVNTDTRTVVMHNAFEPFNPSRSLRLFDDARCIIIDRDPRDNYIDTLKYKPLALPPDKFIKRYRLYRQIARRNEAHSDRVLRLRFEDLVLDYEVTLNRMLAFLGEEKDVHEHPRKFFDPETSKKNVGLWKSYPLQAEIELIGRELNEFCYESGR